MKIISGVLVLLVSGAMQVHAQTPDNSNSLNVPPTPAATPSTDSQPASPANPDDKKVERVEVTGSHIKRIATETASPIVTVTRKDIEKTGANSVGEALRNLGASSFGIGAEQGEGATAAVETVNLRGLGDNRTLILLNGNRLPQDATASATDLNIVPLAAVERIEILKDGASAIYGSDALGGVVNIITKKDFVGNQISLDEQIPQLPGGQKQNISWVNGINGQTYNIVNVLQYRNDAILYAKDRRWNDSVTSAYGSPGSYIGTDGNEHTVASNCPSGDLVTSGSDQHCKFHINAYASDIPAIEQMNLLSEGHFNVGSDWKLTGRLSGMHRVTQSTLAPAPFISALQGKGPNGTPVLAPSTGPAAGLPNTTPGTDMSPNFRTTILGNRDDVTTTNSYGGLFGANYQINNSWDIGVDVSHDEIQNADKGIHGYSLSAAVVNAIQNGAYNPFGPQGDQGTLDGAGYAPLNLTRSELSAVNVRSSGEIGSINGNAISMAVGTGAFYQTYEDTWDEQSVAGNVVAQGGNNGSGNRTAEAAYVEFEIPVAKSLELQIAGREDNYNDFGATFNPKIAVLYHVAPELLLRASAGTGFHAPEMQDMYKASSTGYGFTTDYKGCQTNSAYCGQQQYKMVTGGNTALKPEKATSYTAGAVYEPSSNFNISADFFYTKIKDVVIDDGSNVDDLMRADANGVDTSGYGFVIHRDPGTQQITQIDDPNLNSATREVTGVDISTTYQIHKFKIGEDFSKMFYYRQENIPGQGATNQLGVYGYPGWRNVASLSYDPDESQEFTLSANSTEGQQNSQRTGRITDYTDYDFAYSLKTKSLGTFTAGIRNILGTNPPLDDTNPQLPLNYSLYSDYGRTFVAGYTYHF